MTGQQYAVEEFQARERARLARERAAQTAGAAVNGLVVVGVLAFLGGGAYFFVKRAGRTR